MHIMFSPTVNSPVSFPAELKGCINISPEVTKQQLNEALVSENTREIFKAWSAQHREFCEDSELPVGYDPSVHALPSKAVDNARRLAYNKDIISGSYKKILLHILSELGTIEKA